MSLIQIKRSLNTSIPSSLANGELAYTANGDVLYIGSNDAIVAIGGLRVPGTLTANQAMVVNSTSYMDVIKTANLFIGAVSVNKINAVANSTVIGAATNSELTTTWAIKTYVDAKVAGGSPPGSDTQVIFNDGGAFGADDAFTWDKAANNLTVANSIFAGANVKANTTALFVGNTTVNAVHTQSQSLISNSTVATTIAIGSVSVGANVIANTTAFFIGNSTINAIHSQTQSLYSNSTVATTLAIGSLSVGANVVLGVASLAIGNSTVNTFVNSSLISTTGDITARDMTLSGNLTINGTTTTIDTTNLIVEDPLISLAKNNDSADTVDIGFFGLCDPTGSQDTYTGLFRDASDGKYKLFKDLQAAPTTTVNIGGTGYAVATLVAALESASVTITGGSITGITDLAVADGGTGRSTFATNGVLYGNGTGGLLATAQGDDGKILTSVSGVPTFTDLDGGTF